MSREGNMHCFSIFVEGINFANPLYLIHYRLSALREDLYLNYKEGSILFNLPIITEICAASLFNDNIKDFKEIIIKVCVLLNYHEENQDNRFFLHKRVLRVICKEILIICFYNHHNIKYMKMIRINIFTNRQINYYKIILRDF